MFPSSAPETLLIRGLGTCAFLMLHVILAIGPLCRLDDRFLPLLYNRRHLGVSMFVVAAVHGTISLLQFHAFGPLNPLVSVFVSDGSFGDGADVPFQPFGFVALVILLFMAVTSHDFWLKTLSPRSWKSLHMAVYVAYVLLFAHVMFGYIQDATSIVPAALTMVGALTVTTLHIVSGRRERAADRSLSGMAADGFVDVCPAASIPDGRAHTVSLSGERVAIFRHGDKLSAISAVCQHQNGPLGEGRIVDGLVTCPWHGYQYCPFTGSSPAPFTEQVATYPVRIRNGRVFVRSHPNALDAPTEPAVDAQ